MSRHNIFTYHDIFYIQLKLHMTIIYIRFKVMQKARRDFRHAAAIPAGYHR